MSSDGLWDRRGSGTRRVTFGTPQGREAVGEERPAGGDFSRFSAEAVASGGTWGAVAQCSQASRADRSAWLRVSNGSSHAPAHARENGASVFSVSGAQMKTRVENAVGVPHPLGLF